MTPPRPMTAREIAEGIFYGQPKFPNLDYLVSATEQALVAFAASAVEGTLENVVKFFVCWQPSGPQPDKCPACVYREEILKLIPKASQGRKA